MAYGAVTVVSLGPACRLCDWYSCLMYSLNLAELQPALAGLLSSCVHTQCYLCFFPAQCFLGLLMCMHKNGMLTGSLPYVPCRLPAGCAYPS